MKLPKISGIFFQKEGKEEGYRGISHADFADYADFRPAQPWKFTCAFIKVFLSLTSTSSEAQDKVGEPIAK